MSIYRARLVREAEDSWMAAAIGLPNCWSRGRSRQEALAKLRDEVRYRIELCPCSGVPDDFVEIEVAGETPPAPRPAVSSWSAARPAEPAPLSGAAGCPPARTAAPEKIPAAPPGRRGWRRWDD
jgi:hypothetical protein